MRDLARQVRALIVASDNYRYAFAARTGIGLSDAATLGHLHHHGPQSPSQLALRLNLTPASITSLIDRLESAGYLIRTRHPHDRRQTLLELTTAGSALIESGYDAFVHDVDRAVTDAHPTLVRELSAVLEQITAVLEARAAANAPPRGRRAGARTITP